jgi:hypothetical protein
MRQWMFRRILFFENLLLAVTLSFSQTPEKSSAQEYCWPTDASRVMTSSFCEYRPAHFHAGLDVKTWGRTGYKVFAVQSGSIVRVDVSPYGYGRAVFLKLNDGKTVVYGHLSRFSDRLEPFIEEEQNRRGRFSIQLALEPGLIQVEKGDVVAYTGATGNGVPHLHFEVWDAQDRPLNPLSLGFDLEDTVPPFFEAVAVTPLSYGSHAGGDYMPKIVALHKESDGIFHPEEPLYAWGRIGLSVRLFDKANGAENQFSIYRLCLFIDGQRIHDVRYDWFPPDLAGQIDLDYEFRLIHWNQSYFQKLYRDEGNMLPIYSQDLTGSGIVSCWTRAETDSWADVGIQPGSGDRMQELTVSRGNHTFRIEAFDYFGNRSEASGTLCFLPLFEFLNSRNASEAPWSAGAAAESSAVSLDIDTHFFGETIRFAVRSSAPLSDIPSLTSAYNMWDRDFIPLIPQGDNQFTGSASWKNRGEGIFVMEVRGTQPSGEALVMRDTADVFLVTPEAGGSLVSQDGLFRMTFPVGAVYSRLLGTIRQEKTDMEAAVLPEKYSISASDVPLKKRVKIQLTVPVSERREPTLGIYALDDPRCHFLNSRWEEDTLVAWTRSPGPFCVLQDTVSPEILNISPRPGSRIKDRTPTIIVGFQDTLSGIYGEDNYSISLNHSRLIVEYDPVRNLGLHPIRKPLNTGVHVLDIVIRDRAGNVTRKQSRFTVL